MQSLGVVAAENSFRNLWNMIFHHLSIYIQQESGQLPGAVLCACVA